MLKQVENKMRPVLNTLCESGEPIILYGASACGLRYLELFRKNGMNVIAFCDDDEKKQKTGFCGLPVIPFNDLSIRGGQIVISTYDPEPIYKKIAFADEDLLKRTHMVDFYLWEDGLDYYEYYMQFEKEIQQVAEMLEDDKSRQVLCNVLNYKISRDKELLKEVRDDVRIQYFDKEIVHLTDKEIFLDLGAYRGDTVQSFSEYVHGKYQKIYAFEPDENNFRLLSKVAASMDNTEVYPYGAGEKDEMLHFVTTGHYTSYIDEAGEESIDVRTIDNFLQGKPVSFLKADIEGAEMGMLRGAKHTIRQYKPKLAICVYHNKDDVIQIPLLLKKFCPEYKFYLRHYTEMPIETVLYAI